MDLKKLLLNSLNAANRQQDESLLLRVIHRNMSQNFVKVLASQFREQFDSRPSVRVLSKDDGSHRVEFGLNELLYDILVCETDTTLSVENETLTFVTKALWQIESEFARNCREAVYDFNKLVLGSSENKLFIGPQVTNEEGFLKPLAQLASRCNSNTYVALVPHPSEWKTKELTVHCWRFVRNWEPV